MINEPDIKDLKSMIALAEEELEKLKEDNRREHKQKRITRALERAYALLNKESYTQKEVNKRTHDVWLSLQDGVIPFFWYYLIGFLLACALIFTGIQTYSFISTNWDRIHHIPDIHDDLSSLVTVNYKETNIVSLYDLMPVDDEIGLKNKKEEFNISNTSEKVPSGIDYVVDYNVNIVEMNQNARKIINKRYIKYQLTYEDLEGKTVVREIGRLSDLKQNPDGSFLLVHDSQYKDKISNFKMVLWLASDAGNSEQGASYTFAYKVTAVIKQN